MVLLIVGLILRVVFSGVFLYHCCEVPAPVPASQPICFFLGFLLAAVSTHAGMVYSLLVIPATLFGSAVALCCLVEVNVVHDTSFLKVYYGLNGTVGRKFLPASFVHCLSALLHISHQNSSPFGRKEDWFSVFLKTPVGLSLSKLQNRYCCQNGTPLNKLK